MKEKKSLSPLSTTTFPTNGEPEQFFQHVYDSKSIPLVDENGGFSSRVRG